jgi:hypothetical protein
MLLTIKTLVKARLRSSAPSKSRHIDAEATGIFGRRLWSVASCKNEIDFEIDFRFSQHASDRK